MIILGELIKIRGSDNYSDTGGPPVKGELEGVLHLSNLIHLLPVLPLLFQ